MCTYRVCDMCIYRVCDMCIYRICDMCIYRVCDMCIYRVCVICVYIVYVICIYIAYVICVYIAYVICVYIVKTQLYLKNTSKRPNSCHLLFYLIYSVLKMFRTLMYPSLGACDCAVELPRLSFCSIKTEDLALVYVYDV